MAAVAVTMASGFGGGGVNEERSSTVNGISDKLSLRAIVEFQIF